MIDYNSKCDSWHDYKSTDELYRIAISIANDIKNSYEKIERLQDKKIKAISKLQADIVSTIYIRIETTRNFILHMLNVLEEIFDALSIRVEETEVDRDLLKMYHETKSRIEKSKMI